MKISNFNYEDSYTDKISFEFKSIANGIHDIAQYIGLEPRNTVFDYNVSVNGGVPNAYRSAIQQGIACMARGEPIALTLALPCLLKKYWHDYLKVNNIIEVTKTIDPDNIHDIYKNIDIKNPIIIDILNNKTFVTLRSTESAINTIENLNSKTLQENLKWKFFNSKVRTAMQASDFDYQVSPHVIISSIEDLHQAFSDIKNIASQLGLFPESTKYWFRFDNLSGGIGVRPFNPSIESLDDISNWIYETIEKTENKKFSLIVLDIDISSLPRVKKIIENLNVQGVSGLNDAYFVGVTRQETDLNGKYLRGLLPNNDKSRINASIAALTGMKVIRAAQLQGYRGFAGVDVILAEMTDGSLISFVLEMNARLNSSTSLLSLSHFVATEKKAPFICAENFNIKLKNPMDINEFLFHYDDLLYKAEESNFNGLIPIILHPNTNGDFEIKTVLVASDNDKLSKLNSKLLAFNSNYVINK